MKVLAMVSRTIWKKGAIISHVSPELS